MVDLNFEKPGDHHYIRSVNEKGIHIAEQWYSGSVLVSADRLLPDWPPSTMDELQDSHLLPIFEMKPEVVLLGTGAKQVFLPPRLMVQFYNNGIGIEVMTTDAACRTFNVLVSEGRNVLAALMPA